MGSTRTASTWIIIQSTPLAQSSFLKNILAKKFPHYAFSYQRFLKSDTLKSIAKKATRKPDGILLELKTLNPLGIKTCSKLLHDYRGVPTVLVLTPQGFTLLNSKHRKLIENTIIVLSETKSLDYVLQLPRLIEEVGRKRRLRHQNERLQRMLLERDPVANTGFAGLGTNTDFLHTRKLLGNLLSSDQRSGCALKVTFKNWPKLRSQLSTSAQTEILDLVVRLIGRVVRNSDRVLRSEEDEFTIFLANAQPSHLSRCRERLENSLRDLRIEADEKSLKFPFTISTLTV